MFFLVSDEPALFILVCRLCIHQISKSSGLDWAPSRCWSALRREMWLEVVALEYRLISMNILLYTIEWSKNRRTSFPLDPSFPPHKDFTFSCTLNTHNTTHINNPLPKYYAQRTMSLVRRRTFSCAWKRYRLGSPIRTVASEGSAQLRFRGSPFTKTDKEANVSARGWGWFPMEKERRGEDEEEHEERMKKNKKPNALFPIWFIPRLLLEVE